MSLTSIALSENNISETTKEAIATSISKTSGMQSSESEENTTFDEATSIVSTETSTETETEAQESSTVVKGQVKLNDVHPSWADPWLSSQTPNISRTPQAGAFHQVHNKPPPRVTPRMIAMATQPNQLSKSMTVPVPPPRPRVHTRSKSGPVQFQVNSALSCDAEARKVRKEKEEEQGEEEEDSDTETEYETDDSDSVKKTSVFTSPYYLEDTKSKSTKRHSESLLRKHSTKPTNTQNGLKMAYKQALNRKP